MEDEAHITSVTPTNQMNDNRKPEEPEQNTSDNEKEERVIERAMQDLKNMVTMREELDRADKRKKTEEIFEFIKELKND